MWIRLVSVNVPYKIVYKFSVTFVLAHHRGNSNKGS